MGRRRQESEVESVGQALRRILVTKVLVPIAVFGVVYALVRVVGPIAGLSPSTADTWAWVVGVAVVLVVFAMGEGNAFGRAARHDDITLRLSGRWTGRDFDARK